MRVQFGFESSQWPSKRDTKMCALSIPLSCEEFYVWTHTPSFYIYVYVYVYV